MNALPKASKLPIGLQGFESLRLEGNIYIDKTEYLFALMNGAKYQFISRPRRFGKSLMISTLKAIFEGKKHLFEGLWLEHQHDFKPRPVVRLDFSEIDSNPDRLEESLMYMLRQNAEHYQVKITYDSPRLALQELLLELAKIDQVVVLIDEYDKPITEYLDKPELRDRNQNALRSIYGLFKPMGESIHMVLLTGVSKIGKLSLFSDLNNLKDISLDEQYAKMLGYTKEEIILAFPNYLKNAWEKIGLLEGEFWDILKFWYNGYSWDGIHSLYCPFSFLLFLSDPKFKGYWYETGTPTFLIKLIEEQNFNPLEFESIIADEQTLSTFDLGSLSPISIMFQTGYLTIKNVDPQLYGINYTLGYPNFEVRQAFSNNLLEQYSKQSLYFITSISNRARTALFKLEWDNFFKEVKAAYASIPNIIGTRERHFHALFHMLMCSTGLPVYSEIQTNRGRMDTVIDTRAFYVIFEFKMEGTAQAALEQINAKDYAEQFVVQAPVYKVGVVFDNNLRNIKDWAVA